MSHARIRVTCLVFMCDTARLIEMLRALLPIDECATRLHGGYVGSIKLLVFFAEYRLFYRALLQKRPMLLSHLYEMRHVSSLCVTRRLTQSLMYVPLQVNVFHESILLIVQYKYLKSCCGDFHSPEFDPPHKIMHYWFYYSIWLGFSFPPDHAGLVEMICTTVVPASKGHLGGASP